MVGEKDHLYNIRLIFRVGWNAAVETWMVCQTTFSCSNGVLQLFRYAIKQNDSDKIAFIVHKARMFISASKVNVFLAAAYIIQFRQEEASKVLENSAYPISSYDISHIFRLTNALSDTRYRALIFPFNFMKICLEHTKLIEDEKAIELCNDDLIRLCGEI